MKVKSSHTTGLVSLNTTAGITWAHTKRLPIAKEKQLRPKSIHELLPSTCVLPLMMITNLTHVSQVNCCLTTTISTYLRVSPHTAVEASERHDLLLGHHVLQVSFSSLQVHVFNVLCSLPCVLSNQRKKFNYGNFVSCLLFLLTNKYIYRRKYIA